MKYSVVFKAFLCLSVLLGNYAAAEEWNKVDQAATEDNSPVYEIMSAQGLSCEFFISTLSGNSTLSSCKDLQTDAPSLGLYVLKKQGDSYFKNLILPLGDASNTNFIDFHSPKTIANNTASQSKNKTEERIVLIDVRDEGTCYATEVFKLDSGKFKHLGTIEFFTLKYTMHTGSNSYEQNIACLGEYARVNTKKGINTLTFSAPAIYKMNQKTGQPTALNAGELTYQFSATKLTRTK